MVDYFSLALTHGLLAIAAWRLLARADLDDDRPDAAARRRWAGKGRQRGVGEADA